MEKVLPFQKPWLSSEDFDFPPPPLVDPFGEDLVSIVESLED